ncbi:MAG: ABC transporter ATP-binding protein [Planctomycetota bacterium]
MPTTPSPKAIDAHGLAVRFGRGGPRSTAVDALVDVDFMCATGAFVGLLGANGSGKTTLLRILAGDLVPDRGAALVLGAPPRSRELVSRVAFLPAEPPPYPTLSPREILTHLGALGGMARPAARDETDRLLEALGLATAANRPIDGFSTGMKRRAAIACALFGRPELLLLDEPTAGLDPEGTLLALELFREHRRLGGTIVMASHRLDEVEENCERVVILDRGRVRRDGTLDRILADQNDLLEVQPIDAATRDAVTHAVVDQGVDVVGWSKRRRHLAELLREVAAESDRPLAP